MNDIDTKLEELKKQHRKELECLKIEKLSNKYVGTSRSIGRRKGWNEAVDQFNNKIDNLLNSQKQEK